MDPLIISILLRYPQYAALIIFLSMILTGCNLPISEDLMILLSGVFASTFTPNQAVFLWGAVFVGAYLADQIAYWTGRLIGPKLMKMPLTSQIITPHRLAKVHRFYEKYGFWSFTIGRFIPFGVRNCLFISAGMGKMTFRRFLLIDGFAALLSTTTGFFASYALGKSFGRHFAVLFNYLHQLNFLIIIVAGVASLAVLAFIWYKAVKRKSNHPHDPQETLETPSKD